MSPMDRACRKCSFRPGNKLAKSQVVPQTSSTQSRAREAAMSLVTPGPLQTALLCTTGIWKANYPAGASSSPGEPQTGRGALHGLPQMPLLLCGSATSKRTLPCSEPMETHTVECCTGCCAWGGAVANVCPHEDAPPSPS